MKLLTFEDGVVRLDGVALPGVLVSQRVGCSVRFDEQKVDGTSGTNKTPLGWDDADIMLTLDLLGGDDTDCYDDLKTLNAIFRGVDSRANPKVLGVANRHLMARGIRNVVFSHLSSDERDSDDTIRATLAFVEHCPPIIRIEAAEAKSPSAAELSSTSTVSGANDEATSEPEAEAVLMIDLVKEAQI